MLHLGKTLVASGLLLVATTSLASAKAESWLVRSGLAEPSAADFSDALGVRIDAVEHVVDNLYKVTPAAAGEERLEKAKERVETLESGVVTSVQKNHVYSITLNKPKAVPGHLQALARREAVAALAEDPAIQPVPTSPSRGADPKVSSQWGLTKVHAQQAWNTQRGNKELIVAVIDTGVDYNHEDLRGNMWRNSDEIAGNGVDDDANGYVDDIVGWDFATNDSLPWDTMSALRFDGNPGHGTHCAGVIGGVGENALGISGVAPNVSIMALRFITETGSGETADAVKAINYAVKNGAKILSNSWGGEKDSEDDTEMKNSIKAAQDAGVLLVFAAGNGRNGIGFDNDTDAAHMIPASYDFPAIISVAATDSGDAFGSFSNWGKTSVDVAAPGVTVMSSVPNNGYEDKITFFGIPLADWSGTSMAAPHVAGAAALVWSQYPDLTAAEVKARLLDRATAVPALAGKIVTGGILNLEGSLR